MPQRWLPKPPRPPVVSRKGPIPLYCDYARLQMAEFVRYARATPRDRRWLQPDVRKAIDIKAVLIVGGGYDKAARQVDDTTRT